MVRDKTHISLFNMPLVKTVNSDKGTNLVEDVFQESVKMSTYLVAFVVCDYSSLKNTTKRGTKVWMIYGINFRWGIAKSRKDMIDKRRIRWGYGSTQSDMSFGCPYEEAHQILIRLCACAG